VNAVADTVRRQGGTEFGVRLELHRTISRIAVRDTAGRVALGSAGMDGGRGCGSTRVRPIGRIVPHARTGTRAGTEMKWGNDLGTPQPPERPFPSLAPAPIHPHRLESDPFNRQVRSIRITSPNNSDAPGRRSRETVESRVSVACIREGIDRDQRHTDNPRLSTWSRQPYMEGSLAQELYSRMPWPPAFP